MKAISFVFLTLFYTQLASAKHLALTSAEGIEINIDYAEKSTQSYGCWRCNIMTSATALKITINSAQLKADDKIHVVLKSNSHFDTSPELKILDVFEPKMSKNGNGLSYEIEELLIGSEGYGGKGYFSQELIVEINGVPLVNAETKTTKFILNL